MDDLKKTPLYDLHVKMGAKMVPFYGWAMPLHYGSQLKEHEQVRARMGMFDVSHMTLIDITGDDRKAFLMNLLANDVRKLRVIGQAQYTLMLNEQGGILDDLIVYHLADRYRLVVNCGTREKILSWLEKSCATYPGVKAQERSDLAMVAIQGPQARQTLGEVLGDEARRLIAELLPFTSAAQTNWQIARTGYTGEDGVEVILPVLEVADLWERLSEAGIQPCGLGARDTLRLEAGLNLYGQDMDETTTPWEARLGWTVAMKDDRSFTGRTALAAQRDQGVPQQFIGLIFEGKGVLRAGFEVVQEDRVIGKITSGSFSPTLGYSVALARVSGLKAEPLQVQIRGRQVPVLAVKPPFYRQGKAHRAPLFEAAEILSESSD